MLKIVALGIMIAAMCLVGAKYDEKVVANEEDVITYTIDENSEITYYADQGEYGRIEYKKKHYTTGSGIKYYTRRFVISVGKINDYTNLEHMSSDESISFLVSEDGRSYSKEEVDTSKDFYWYETEPDKAGYVTTTYSLDGRYFYELIGNAASNGKNGEIYIHHVFAIAGGSNSDWWHQNYNVVNNKEYWTYNDLFKLEWNDTAKTRQSQELCKNVPVPFKRNVRFVTCFYDNTGKAPLLTNSSMVDFFQDKEGTIANSVSTTIQSQLEINGKMYEVYKSKDTPFVYKWIKVPAGFRNPSESFYDPVRYSYDSNVADGDRIKTKAVTNNGEIIPNGCLNDSISTTFKLGDNISSYTWVVILYVPVREMVQESTVYLHFFDVDMKTGIGSSILVNQKANVGKSITIRNLSNLLGTAGLDDYEVAYDSGSEFIAGGNSLNLLSDYNDSYDKKYGQGILADNSYSIDSINNDPCSVIWIPVSTQTISIPVYLRYVSNNGETIKDCGVYALVSDEGDLRVTPPKTLSKNGKQYTLAEAKEYGVRRPKVVYSKNRTDLSAVNYNDIKDEYGVLREEDIYICKIDSIDEVTAIKVFVPYSIEEDETLPVQQTGVVISYIDSVTGEEISSEYRDNVQRGGVIEPITPGGYSIDLNGIKYLPSAICKNGITKISCDYSEQFSGEYGFLNFENKSKCSIIIPMADDAKLGVKVWVPIKKVNTVTNVIVKYFSLSASGIKEIETNVAGSYGFDKNIEIQLKDSIYVLSENQTKVYTTKSVSGILFGNDADLLWGGKQYLSELMGMIDGTRIMGYISSYSYSESLDTVALKTEEDGAYHTIYVLCEEITDATNLTIYYIDADDGSEIQKDYYASYLKSELQIWTGIEGNLVWALGVTVLKDVIDINGEKYIPTIFAEAYEGFNEKVHTGCNKGEILYFDYANNRNIYFCRECGIVRREVPLNQNGFETDRSNWRVYDDNSYKNSVHKYYSYSFSSNYEIRYSYGRDTYIPSILVYNRAYSNCSKAKIYVNKDAKSLYLPVGENIESGTSLFSGWPIKNNDITELVIYIPCVKQETRKLIPVDINYITLTDDAHVDEVIVSVSNGSVLAGSGYRYSGVNTVEKNGVTYHVLGIGDYFIYNENDYYMSLNTESAEFGQKAIYNGIDSWETVEKTPEDIDSLNLYIVVKKDVEPAIPSYEQKDDIKIELINPNASASVQAGEGLPFNVSRAIPSSEYVYSRIKARNYLLSATIKNITGYLEKTVTVIQPYTVILYEEEYMGDGTISRVEVDRYDDEAERTVLVKRPYSYWTIDNAAYYLLSDGTVINPAVNAYMDVQFNIDTPEARFQKMKTYVEWLDEPVDEIILSPIEVTGTINAPPITPVVGLETALKAADEGLPSIRVRNDRMVFDGNTILDSSWTFTTEGITDNPTNTKIVKSVFASEASREYQIPDEKSNQKYESRGYVRYTLKAGINCKEQTLKYDITNINSVVVHTPVISQMQIVSDNLKYVQAINYDEGIAQVVLGCSESEDSIGCENISNDFSISIDNEGAHIDAPGYGKNINTEKYVKENQVMFEFDVIADVGNDLNMDNDILIKAGSWHSVYDRYYVPEWVTEGIYNVHIRTLAINSSENNDGEENRANILMENYIASSIGQIQISGKLYGFTITGINSTADEWRNVFYYGNELKNAYPSKYRDGTDITTLKFDALNRYYYSVGGRNELGITKSSKSTKYIIPLLNGSSPSKTGMGLLKSGYTWNFKMETVGSITAKEKSAIVIIPSFYWISSDGKRERVDLWYTVSGNGRSALIRVGDDVDNENRHYNYPYSASSGIASKDLDNTLLIREVLGIDSSKKLYKKNTFTYSYGLITNNGRFKTLSGDKYASSLVNNGIVNSGVQKKLSAYKQTWYFEYSLPSEWNACRYGYDVRKYIEQNGMCDFTEKFWYKKDGYLVVHFEIGVYDSSGLIMTYSNYEENIRNGCCDMWEMEGYVNNRQDSNGNTFLFEEGDIFVVGAGRKYTSAGDYETDHLN